MPDADDADAPGLGIVHLGFLGTGALAATSVAAAVLPDTFGVVHAGVSLALFVIGTGALLWAYALGVSRSRTDLVGIPGLFLLAGATAPVAIRRQLRVAVGVQVVVVVVAAAVRPFSEVAFGILAPMFGLGLMGMWGGRHGRFPLRPPKQTS